ncbi:uncharacterized protein LOC115879034 [Sitophilus oryzae]|uniref:Uncharacterized protein LOC115879034 n=1 Tax=Sitophilus oryzae TaxID=7048 RepID=A0A6J2XJQ4_SITOR|nr:uncharacterized protein LOC115879034 [Sitophilus oryzae]XP_030751527.1 uncharacterized protein LOC115879034 [Sitophilus oryzae]
MNKFLVFASFLAVAFARPGLLEDQDGLVSVSQSSLGTYKYSVQLRDSSRLEERLPDGTVIGEYTVPNELGVLQTFKYVAGIDGFRIIEGPLPVAPVDNGIAPLPVQETPEVFAARNALLQPVAPVIINPELPLPVTDTPEVRAAREEFLALHRAAALSNIV